MIRFGQLFGQESRLFEQACKFLDLFLSTATLSGGFLDLLLVDGDGRRLSGGRSGARPAAQRPGGRRDEA